MTPERDGASRRPAYAVVLTYLALMFALAFHARAAAGVSGLLLNADDGYIHAHLAENLARTGVLGLNPGVASGGTSSLPWTLLLALFAALGIPADRVAWSLSLICWALAARAGLRLVGALLPRGPARWIAGFGLVASGHLLAVSLSGLEAPLFLWCVLSFLSCYEREEWGRAAAWAALATATRPEGILLGITALLVSMTSGERFSVALRDRRRTLLVPAASVAALSVTICALIALGGELPSTLEGRRWLAELPGMPWDHPAATLRASALFLWSLARRLALYIGPGRWVGIPWAVAILGLCGVGFAEMVRRGGGRRLLAVYVLAHFVFFGVVLPTPGQLGRYFAPIWALFPLLATVGWFALRSRRPGRARSLTILAAAMVVGYVPQLVRWSGWHAGAVHHMDAVHRQSARWIAIHVDPSEPVAAFDIGLLACTVPNRIVDLGGITSRKGLETIREGTVPSLLAREGVRYVILPEFRGANRWYVANLLRVPVGNLQLVCRFVLGDTEVDHVWPTIIACPAHGIYRWEPDPSIAGVFASNASSAGVVSMIAYDGSGG